MTDTTAVAFDLVHRAFPGPVSTSYKKAPARKALKRKRGLPAGQQHSEQQQPRSPMLSPTALHIFSTGQHSNSSSTDIRNFTPDLEDIPCGRQRKRTCRTASPSSPSTTSSSAHSSPSTDSAGNMDPAPAAPAQDHTGEVHAAAAGALPASHASPVQVLPAATSLKPAEPFSLGVQWEAYYGKPTTDMPGYPAGYWQAESSPFAAMASNPNWEVEATEEDYEEEEEEDTEFHQVPAVPFTPEAGTNGNATEVNSAAWVFDTSDMVFP